MSPSFCSLGDWLSYVESCHPESIELGLERVKQVGESANLLNFSVPIVMVAGTNGKGSTVASLAKLLQVAGLRVGTYTSPHLIHFNERIQINGDLVSDVALINAFEKVERFRAETLLTFFEFTTLVAFDVFQQASPALDIIILEVGLGGRLDAVNVVCPTLSIITSIGLDHQAFLGETVDEIALEKAGILREGIPVVLGKTSTRALLLSKVKEYNNVVYIEGQHFDFCKTQTSWRFGDKTDIPLEVYLPQSSVSLAMAAYTILSDFHFSLPSLCQIAPCLQDLTMVGRCYPVDLNGVKVIFDVGHNPDGSRWLAKKIANLALKRKIVAVWASMADKDLSGIVEPMKAIVQRWYIGKVGIERGAKTHALKLALHSHQINNINEFETILEAFSSALAKVNENELLLVFGSFYTVSQIMHTYLTQNIFQNNGLILCEEQDQVLLNGLKCKS
ncbi:MAG: bifunctional folylpolyglutamate synthase/dihydrofolate synthase [Proteobacteria bacterium]|nr:bifunctional folylpolyglutamate synthase/dihydrofolate synthase [Pseudomonadota bacterium]